MSKKQGEQLPPPDTPAARIFEMQRTDEGPAAFAKRLGISHGALNEMRKGKGWPGSEMLARIVSNTNADPAYLLFGSGPQEVKGPDRARLEEIAAILQRAGVIPAERAQGRQIREVLGELPPPVAGKKPAGPKKRAQGRRPK